MGRKLYILALAVVALHVLVTLTLAGTSAGSFCGNLLQTTASGIAAAMAIAAARRGRGLGRSMWLLVGFGWATWGIANLGWMFYEVALGIEPPHPFVRAISV